MTSGKPPDLSERSFHILYKEDIEKSLMDDNQEQPDYLNTTNTSSLPELCDLQSQFQTDMTDNSDDEHDNFSIPVIITSRSDIQPKPKKIPNLA
jgi:hypothetical protein